MNYKVKLTPAAAEMFKSIHPEIRKQTKTLLRALYVNPYVGKPLQNKLSEFRSLKMKRYRIVYRLDEADQLAVIYGIGHRKNIYEVISELMERF